MQINDKPFSFYDFLGYLIPGIFGVYSSVFLYKYVKDGTATLNIFQPSGSLSEEAIISVIFFYVVGHLLSFFSSMSVEKYSVWTLGYPSSYLFNKSDDKGFFKGCLVIDDNHKIGSIARCIARFLIRLIVFIILMPVFLGDIFVRKIFRLHDMYARSFDDNLMKVVEENTHEILLKFQKKSAIDTSGDTFRLIYHYACEISSNHISKMQNYVALYGFTRTLTFIGCLLFWEWIVLNWNSLIIIMKYNYCSFLFTINFKNFGILFMIIFLTFFLYWDFNKFYRKFSMEAYLGAIVADKKEGKC